MEATGFKAKGSFGVPPEMQRDLEEQRRKAAVPRPQQQSASSAPHAANVVPEQAPIVDATPAEMDEKALQEKTAKDFTNLKTRLETRLETSITPEDIKQYIFKGVLIKEVAIFPGYLKGAFRTVTPDEYLLVDEREAAFRDEAKYTLDGIQNQRAIVTLSYAWIAADGKPLSAQNDPTVREKHIRKLGAHVVEAAIEANTDFNTLLKISLREKAFIKKS